MYEVKAVYIISQHSISILNITLAIALLFFIYLIKSYFKNGNTGYMVLNSQNYGIKKNSPNVLRPRHCPPTFAV